MNVWFISKYAALPKYAKVPSRLFYIAREFAKLGNEVSLITSDSNHLSSFPTTNRIYNSEIIDNVIVRWIKTIKYGKTASIARVFSWFDFERKLFFMNLKKTYPPDVVIVSSLSIFSIIFGYYLKKRFKAYLVFEIRDIWPLTMTEEGGFSKWHPLVWLIGWVEKFGYRKADLVVGTMPRLDFHIHQILGYDKPFFCSPIGFDPQSYIEMAHRGQNPFLKYTSEKRMIVGYAGSIGITNSLEPFVETIKIMSEYKHILFLLVGSGDLKEKFQQELSNYDNVIFLPRIAQNEVKYFLDICDILYLSTKYSKVWDYGQSMNKVVEYMLASKPIIASYSGYPSMINEANCGCFVEDSDPKKLSDVILYYANMSKDERDSIGKRGNEWIINNREYSYLAQQYVQILTQTPD